MEIGRFKLGNSEAVVGILLQGNPFHTYFVQFCVDDEILQVYEIPGNSRSFGKIEEFARSFFPAGNPTWIPAGE